MTALQKTFLMYTFVYFLAKGGLFVALYVALVIVEKDARMRFAKLRVFLERKREGEQERWSTAYRLLAEREATRRAAEQAMPVAETAFRPVAAAAASSELPSEKPIAA